MTDGRRVDAVRLIELVVCNFHRKSSSVFSIVVRVFLDESSDRKSFRFLQALVKLLSSELNILPYSISTQEVPQ